MNSFNDGRQRFAKWIRDRREELNLTEDEFAERLDIVVAVVLMWEVGNTYWESLPKGVKDKVEALCGEYTGKECEDASTHREFRESAGTAFADEIEQAIEMIRAEESNCTGIQGNSDYFGSTRRTDAIELVCGCGTAIWLSHDGQCPNCKKRSDPSQ